MRLGGRFQNDTWKNQAENRKPEAGNGNFGLLSGSKGLDC
jgi:hypothetical protein